MKSRLLGLGTNLIVLTLSIASLLAPFFLPQVRKAGAEGASFPVMVSLIIVLCLFIVLYEIQNTAIDSKMVAFLGVLIAINTGLRFLENAIPGPAGFSPIFLLIILTGYAFGSRIGFLLGAMTMFVSGLITGGIGPWLPGQMITAGWVGQSAGLLKPFIRTLHWQRKPGEWILLSAFGAFWGMLFGAIMNLWFWPFLAAPSGQLWSQNAGMLENLSRYAAYYLATSLVWDLTRAIGNVLLISLMAPAVLRILLRFQQRFTFQVVGESQS